MPSDPPELSEAEKRALIDALGVDLGQLGLRARAAIEALAEEVIALREEADTLRASLADAALQKKPPPPPPPHVDDARAANLTYARKMFGSVGRSRAGGL